MTPRQLLTGWLNRQLPIETNDWLQQSAQAIESSANEAALYLAVSLVSRKTGKAGLILDEDDLRNAQDSCPGWNPQDWTLQQASRLCLLLSLEQDAQRLAHCLEQLCMTADSGELVTFYRGLPLYPEPPRYVARATEGLRSNILAIFEAVAHYNPYPAAHLEEPAWNQMVLKALFTGSPLWPIVGLEQRCNATLAVMLCDYAHERWSARRPVSPELWRCVGPYATGQLLQNLQQVLAEGTPLEQQAAALALHDSPDPAAAVLLQSHPALYRQVSDTHFGWDDLLATGRNTKQKTGDCNETD